jgi:Xaa-Pro aminopeptidase
MDHEGRIAKLQARLTDEGLDGLLINNLTNVRYLTGFSGSNAQLLITEGKATFMTDGRYRARAGDLVRGVDIVIYPDRLADVLPGLVRSTGVDKLGIESTSVTLAEWDTFESAAGGATLVPTSGLVEGLRRTKDADEVALL